MARDRVKTGSLTFQIQKNLEEKLAIGQSKHADKLAGGLEATKDKIYSWGTFNTYMKHANYFANWAKENHGCRTLEECRGYAPKWLEMRKEQGLSSYTLKLEAAALAKVYGCKSSDFGVDTGVRNRANITRSRGERVRDKHFSEERNKELVDFCRGTGLRRSELEALKGNQLVWKNNEPHIGTIGKGGRYREAPIIGPNKQTIVDMMQKAGANKVFDRVHNGADIHGYRADYAMKYYEKIARPIESIPFDRVNKGSGHKYQSQVYHGRGDMKGTKWDREAMKKVSQALGHNRVSVIAGHYIR